MQPTRRRGRRWSTRPREVISVDVASRCTAIRRWHVCFDASTSSVFAPGDRGRLSMTKPLVAVTGRHLRPVASARGPRAHWPCAGLHGRARSGGRPPVVLPPPPVIPTKRRPCSSLRRTGARRRAADMDPARYGHGLTRRSTESTQRWTRFEVALVDAACSPTSPAGHLPGPSGAERRARGTLDQHITDSSWSSSCTETPHMAPWGASITT